MMPSRHELSRLWSLAIVSGAESGEPAEMIFARNVARAVAEACAKLVDKSMSTGEPRDLAAAIREMAKEIK